MKRRLVLAAVATVALLAVGSTLAWSATRGSSSRPAAQSPAGQSGQFDMRAMMQRVHPGLDPAEREQIIAECTKAMQGAMGAMHGSGSGEMGQGMMGTSSGAGMMGAGAMGAGMMGGSMMGPAR